MKFSSITFLLTALILSGSTMQAALRTVTNSNDSGTGSLRTLIGASIAGDTITFTPGLTGMINLTSGEIAIGRDVTIIGPGATKLMISGNISSAVFRIISGRVNISGLTIAFSSEANAGVLNETQGSLVLTDCIIRDNRTAGVQNKGAITMKGCAVFDNEASFSAGFVNSGLGTIINCTIANNGALSQGVSVSDGFLGVTNCTITGHDGPGILGSLERVMIRNSIIAGNGRFLDGLESLGDVYEVVSSGFNLIGKTDAD